MKPEWILKNLMKTVDAVRMYQAADNKKFYIEVEVLDEMDDEFTIQTKGHKTFKKAMKVAARKYGKWLGKKS